MKQGILFDYSSVFAVAAGTTLNSVREIATNHGVAESDIMIVCTSDQTLLNVWPTARRLTITSMPKNTSAITRSAIEQIAREGKLSSLIVLSYDNDVLRTAQQLAFDGLTIVPRHLKAVNSRAQTVAHPQSAVMWRFDSIATLDEAVSDLIQTLTRASAMSEGTGLSLTEIRPLMKGVNRRWAGKSSMDGTIGMIRDLLAIAKQRGLIADARNATSVHPVVWLTPAGKQLAENAAAAVVSRNAESGVATAVALPPEISNSAQTEPPVNKVAQASSALEFVAKQTKKRPLSQMEQICRKLGYGPFSTVRGHVYDELEAVVRADGQKPLTLNEAIFEAIEHAKPRVTVRVGAESETDGDPRRRCWPLVNEMLQRLLPKSHAVLT